MILPILKIRPSGQKLVYDVLMLDLAAKRVKFMLDQKKRCLWSAPSRTATRYSRML